MNSIIWKGVSSTTIKGLIISELPPISKPEMRVMETVIDGINGSQIEDLGYNSYDKPLTIGLYGDYNIDEVIKYFTGEGEVVFSNEPDKVYRAKINAQIDYNRLLRYRQATVLFRTQPYKYAFNEEISATEVGTASGTSIVVNDSENANLKEFKIYGKSTQDGTPTPDAPIDIVSLGADGNVGANVSGKNLLHITKSEVGEPFVSNGITFTLNSDGGITMNGTASAMIFYNMDFDNSNIKYPNQTRLIANAVGLVGEMAMVVGYFDDDNVIFDNFANVTSATPSVEYTLPKDAKRGRTYIRLPQGITLNDDVVYPMIRLANATSEFEPYKTEQSLAIEVLDGLKGIPVTDESLATYTDAEGKMWYADEIDLERGVYVQRCYAETVTMKYEATNNRYMGETSKNANTQISSGIGVFVLSDKLPYNENAGKKGTQINGVRISNADENSVIAYYNEEAVSSLQLVYPLETPIETPLTEEQIAICKSLKANNPTTTIFNDENAYMSVEYLKPYEVENKGFETSRPIMTITGNGTVEISVNGVGIFSYTFPEGDNQVVIDSEKEDAYLGAVLKNRNMNGEFPILQPGMNKIEWTGDVESIEIEPKSRWL